MRANFQGDLSPIPPRHFAAPVVRQDRPAYRILKECFLDDVMYFEGQMIYWDEEPNKEMEPLNSLAEEAINAFFDSREELAKQKSAANGMKYIPLRRPISEDRERNNTESRRPEIVKGDGGVPVLGARKRGQPKAEVISNVADQTPIYDTVRKRGRPKKEDSLTDA